MNCHFVKLLKIYGISRRVIRSSYKIPIYSLTFQLNQKLNYSLFLYFGGPLD